VPSWSWAAVGKVRIKFRSWPSSLTHIISDGLQLLRTSYDPEIPLKEKGTIKVRTRLKRALLRFSHDCRSGHFEHDNISGSHYPLFGNRVREQPHFPGLIIDMELNQIVGEVALDTPIEDILGVSCQDESDSPPSLEKRFGAGL
jgi:hypothetical protein